MDFRLIQNWNSRVKPEDIVFHVGDFCFKGAERSPKSYIEQLIGQIIFIKGNHDTHNSVKTCIEDIRIHLGGKELLLIHNPNETYFGFDLTLVGHVHQKWKFKSSSYKKLTWDMCNIGVDVWDFHPINIEEILKEYGKWKNKK